jgi:hypothetical protein
MQARHFVIPALALVAASLLAAGCGGGGSTPAVANIGTSTGESSSDGSSSGSGDSNGSRTKGDDGAAFSACMRSHGVRNFPDPSSEGGIDIRPNMGIDPDSATFKAAEKACQKELDIKPPSAAEQAKMQEQALKFSACMRAHGVPKFPDPQFSGGTARLKLDRRSGIDPRSPVFQAAEKACRNELPGAKTGDTPSRDGTESSRGTTGP